MAKRTRPPIKSTSNIIRHVHSLTNRRVHVYVAHGSVEQGGQKS